MIILKESLTKYFRSKYFQLKQGKAEYFERLFRLRKNIANAILLERQEENAATISLQQKPYPHFYTNNLICAYLWNAFPEQKIG